MENQDTNPIEQATEHEHTDETEIAITASHWVIRTLYGRYVALDHVGAADGYAADEKHNALWFSSERAARDVCENFHALCGVSVEQV